MARASSNRARERFVIAPKAYSRIAWVALGAFTVIVLTGAAVRLTGSGLGCPEWPKCYGKLYPPLSTHAVIEYGNRTLTVPVTLAAIAAFLGALRRRPYRRDLVWVSLLLPLGVVAQAVLGGLTVEGHLAYGWVMGHFCLSMLLLVAAWQLVWRARSEPPPRRTDGVDRRLVWLARGLVALGALTIFAGTAATAAGPHSGGEPGQPISRLDFDGAHTMDFVIHRHAEVAIAFGLAAVLFWWLCRRLTAPSGASRAATWLVGLIAAQGLVGAVQYETHLPTELVWVHVALATFTWLATLWTHSVATTAVPSAGEVALAAAGGQEPLAARGVLGST